MANVRHRDQVRHCQRFTGETPNVRWLSSVDLARILRVSDVTRILEAIQRGDSQAADELLPVVYDELRRIAAYKMAQEAAGHTLQPTALVHEAWLRLAGPNEQAWQNRAHFFGAAAEAMRRILVEHARKKQALKRGAGVAHEE